MSRQPSGPRRKPIHRFALHAAVLLGLFAIAPQSRELYPRALQAAGNALFASMGRERSVVFRPVAPDSRADRSDTQMVGRAQERRRWRAVFSLHRRGYWATAALVAAILATPMTRPRRAAAVLGGIVLQSGFLLIQLVLLAWCAFAVTEPGALKPDPGWQRALDLAQQSFNSPVPGFAVAFVLWALLARLERGIDLERANRLLLRWRRPPPEGSPR